VTSGLYLVTRDGVELHVSSHGPPDADTAVVFGHGFTGSSRNPKVVGLGRRFAASGVAFHAVDFRGHGRSGGLSTLGELEVLDLDAVVDRARRHHRHVVSVGASMGGLVAVRHAAQRGAVDAVIAISSPGNGARPELARARLLSRLAGTDRGRRLLRRYGTRVDATASLSPAPVDLTRISPVPVVIVHGGRDHYVPVADARALFEELAPPRKLLLFPRFGHGEAGFGASFDADLVALVRAVLDRQDELWLPAGGDATGSVDGESPPSMTSRATSARRRLWLRA
jgi:pimeloyl-ACP methyl ester carboxylesterase